MPKKYTVSEVALRKLVKQMISEEIEKQNRQPEESYIDEYPEEPWVYFGEPEQVEEQKNVRGVKKQQEQAQNQEFPGWDTPFYPEYDEFGAPPFLNRQQKKK